MASARKNLRAVGPNDKPVAKLSVSQAAATGDHRSLLVAMRERIAATVSNPDCPPRDLAALTRRLQDIAKEIEQIDLRAKEDGADAADVAADEEWDASAL
ncbi:hypothetical protein [Microbacterium sp. MPKO10]|uniref:hypothetical protein n=1 Tax=Microbacterium sp. MPKO10 TaxID=2989818 RepID=UPI002236992D|nr:hypothetical protein [Microbacterium sp. MPKO10]MCW4458176.1 hypothetical protein [Microbacterium sp. MPKO10]